MGPNYQTPVLPALIISSRQQEMAMEQLHVNNRVPQLAVHDWAKLQQELTPNTIVFLWLRACVTMGNTAQDIWTRASREEIDQNRAWRWYKSPTCIQFEVCRNDFRFLTFLRRSQLSHHT